MNTIQYITIQYNTIQYTYNIVHCSQKNKVQYEFTDYVSDLYPHPHVNRKCRGPQEEQDGRQPTPSDRLPGALGWFYRLAKTWRPTARPLNRSLIAPRGISCRIGVWLQLG